MEVPEVRFADAHGVRIAWQQFGQGPPLLMIPPLVSNVEIAWEHEYYRRFLEYLALHLRVIAFDKRGMGLSDRFRSAPTLEARTDDILAVLDAAGVEQVAIGGVSEGGLMAQLFTALHPERVERLVLINSLPGVTGSIATHTAPDGTLGPFEDKLARFGKLVETWGQDPQYMVDWLSPYHSGDSAFVRWVGRLQRQSATAQDVGRQIESLTTLDAVDRLGEIAVPTLILHAARDHVVPFATAQWLADRIAGATVVELDSDDHFALTDPRWRDFTDALIEFVTGSSPTREVERRLQTVVFTDIVGSTTGAAAAGDEAWHRLLDAHDRIAWETVDRHAGSIVKSTGDGVLARFDSPSNGVTFAAELRRALVDLGLQIRCGVHTGEVELRANGDVAGFAVNLAARVEQACDDGAIFVSSTVCDLLLGGALLFEDRGEHHLKGVDRPWRLFSLASNG